eukprot:m.109517 g.109517  ORF g.109517 m.109517 type:complete len:251 (+) comp14310_c0_seq1:1253-2005(+)
MGSFSRSMPSNSRPRCWSNPFEAPCGPRVIKKMSDEETENVVETIVRRNVPGTRTKDLFAWPDQALEDIDSSLASQQFIQQFVRQNPADVVAMVTVPEGSDDKVWQYEHLRQFCLELNDLAVVLEPECTATSCPQMKATDEWLYLCAAHKSPKECSAISYIYHTLDGATSFLNNEKLFPNRNSIPETSVTKMPSIARRIYRIFAHAYYHHTALFTEFEARRHLCKRFHAFSAAFEMVTEAMLVVPAKALG